MTVEEIKKRIEEIVYKGGEPEKVTADIIDFIFGMNKKKTMSAEYLKEVTEFIDRWMELYPKGVRSGGKLLRSDKKECISKMAKFMKDYPDYTPDIIMAATKAYLSERSRNDFERTICATYFIHRQGVGSELAAHCAEYQALNKSGTVSEIIVKTEKFSDFFI